MAHSHITGEIGLTKNGEVNVFFVVHSMYRTIFAIAVREMTMNAMGGNVTFRKALQDRLSLINPSQSQIKEFIAQHPPHLTPGIKVLS